MGKATAPKTEPKYGKIPGVDVGACFEDRDALLASGVHTAPQAGICYSERFGAYSVLLNGGYEDDVDEGNRIVYTGQGKGDVFGKNGSAKGVQQGDQSWTRGNLGLKRSFGDRRSVRVIRGSQCGSRFAPESGFRYDGLYKVTHVCRKEGREGYWVCRFKMQRESDQPPIPTRSITTPTTLKKKLQDGVRRAVPIPRPSTPVASSSKRRLVHDSARVHERVYARSMGLQPPHIHSPSPAPSPARPRPAVSRDGQRTGELARRASASTVSTSAGLTPSFSSRPIPQANVGTPLRKASGSSTSGSASAAPTSTSSTASLSTRPTPQASTGTLLRKASGSAAGSPASTTLSASAAPTFTGPTPSSLSTQVSQSRGTLLRTASYSAPSTSTTPPNPSSSNPKPKIIDLTLDEDEDDAPPPPPRRTAPVYPPSGTKRAFIDLTMDDSDSEDETPRRAKHRRPRWVQESEPESCPSSPGPSTMQLQKVRREEGSAKAGYKESRMAPL